MKHHNVFLSLLLGLPCCMGLLQTVAMAEPPFQISPKLFDRDSDTLGLVELTGEHRTLFRATEESYQYCHHPNLVVFRDRLVCMWSNGIVAEDEPGQRILYCHTKDGINWTKPIELANHKQGKGVCVSAGFLVSGKTLIAFYTTTDGENFGENTSLIARTSVDAQIWSEPRRIVNGFFIEGPRQLPSGRLLLSGENVGPQRKTKRMKLLYTDSNYSLGRWEEADIEMDDINIFSYTEPGFFSREDGTLVMSFRNRSGFLYASESTNQGKSWSTPAKTNFPDCRARFSAGNLPDGTAYLISNPGPGHRRYLTIALSDDCKTFDRAFMIFGKPIRHRYGGRTKSHGWQYPNAVVWKDHLHIAYSINKEDLGTSRIALKELQR
ncbi:hypothetical protein Pan241w_18010 [Gimesia alba]|uniref:Sialidase domain-containing protein n=1 Tax=Gimesia alba TaxID=2527973 RepID=A0A517RCX8_9PLAN|nr:exo-alpha-sialidase [Gimesia alba]QDT41738.1 hypothetical protein Pan241w_18010 [Gimesia alba]